MMTTQLTKSKTHPLRGSFAVTMWVSALLAFSPGRCLAQAGAEVNTLEPPGTTALAALIDAVVKRVSPSVVNIISEEAGTHVTGTIIHSGGWVLTCAHIRPKVGDAVKIRFADGKIGTGQVAWKMAETDLFGRDFALVRLAGADPWPAVPVGPSGVITERDGLIAIGYGLTDLFAKAGEQQPRFVKFGYRITVPWAQKPSAMMMTTIRSVGGDSGGPVFDLAGRLIGVTAVGDLSGTHCQYTMSDVLWKNRSSLPTALKDLQADPKPPPLAVPAGNAVAAAVRAVRASVVELRSDTRCVSGGIVVGKGEVLAKASELGPHLTVVFPDDFVGSAQVIATDWTRDLALVRVPADYTDRARSLDWEAARDAAIGTLVAAVTPEGHEPEVGVICGPSLPLPAVPGMLPVRVEDAAEGAKVTEVFPQLCSLRLENVFPLKVGDVITRVGGMAIKDGSAFRVLFDGPSIGQVSRVSGNPVTIHYLRAGRQEDATMPMVDIGVPTQRVRPYSHRFTGFPTVFSCHLAPGRPENCGTPVVDSAGQLIGLLIGRAPYVESLVLPAKEVKASLDDLRRRATPK
jgi:serine protease Do